MSESAMDQKAFSAAKEKLGLAKSKLDAICAAKTVKELAQEWSEFLTEAQRVFTKMRIATRNGASKGWYDHIEHQRSNDELLSYIRHARNADEHGIDSITETKRGGISISTTGSTHIKSLVVTGDRIEGEISGSPLLIKRTPDSVVLVPVRDRGATYSPPDRHLEKPVDSCTPRRLAELATAFMERVVAEAEQKFASMREGQTRSG